MHRRKTTELLDVKLHHHSREHVLGVCHDDDADCTTTYNVVRTLVHMMPIKHCHVRLLHHAWVRGVVVVPRVPPQQSSRSLRGFPSQDTSPPKVIFPGRFGLPGKSKSKGGQEAHDTKTAASISSRPFFPYFVDTSLRICCVIFLVLANQPGNSSSEVGVLSCFDTISS